METSKREPFPQILSFRSFLFTIILAVIVYLGILILSDWEDLIANIFKINPIVVILAMFLSLLNYFCRFIKWHLFTRSLELEIPVKDNFLIFFAGLSLAITPAKVGEAIRAFLLQKTSTTELSKGLASTFSERLVDLVAVTILALIGVFVLGFSQSLIYLPLLVLILLGILFGVLFFLFDPLYNSMSWIFHLKPWASIGLKIDRFRSDVVTTFHYDVFFGSLFIGIIGWACEALGFFLLALNLGIPLTIEASLFIYTISSLLGAISFLPGGLGVVEGSMELFLADLLAISLPLAGSLIILIRLTTLWFGVSLGTIFLIIVTRRISREQHKDQ